MLNAKLSFTVNQGRSQDFSKGGSQRLLTRLSCRPSRQHIVMAFSPPEDCRLFAQKKAYQGGGGGGGGGSRAPQAMLGPIYLIDLLVDNLL